MSALASWLQGGRRSGLRLLILYAAIGVDLFALQVVPLLALRLIGSFPSLIFIAKIVPFPVAFLMLFGIPFVIPILVHVALLHLAWRAIRGRIVRSWLLLPLGFYGGGYALHLASVHAAGAAAALIDAQDAAVHLSVDKPFRYLSEGNTDTLSLIERYRVDRVFRRYPGTVTTYYYARGTACDSAAHDPHHKPWTFKKDLFPYWRGEKTRQCILEQDNLPADWRYRINVTDTSFTGTKSLDVKSSDVTSIGTKFTDTSHRVDAFLFDRRQSKIFDIFDERDKRRLATIEVTSFATFPIVPVFVAACGIDQSFKRLGCAFGLLKAGPIIDAGFKPFRPGNPEPAQPADTWEIMPLARALGLEPRLPTD